MRLTFARVALGFLFILIALNFVFSYRSGDNAVWAGSCLAVAVLAIVLGEWLQLRQDRHLNDIERAERDMLDELDVERRFGGEG